MSIHFPKWGQRETDEVYLGAEEFGLKPGGEGSVETLAQQVTRMFQAWRGPVYFYLLAFLGDPTAADDIAQEVFLRLYRQLHAGRSIEQERLWIFRVAHNLACDEQRRRAGLESYDAPGWRTVRDARADTAPDPEQRLLEQERFRRLAAALPFLSVQERQCLLLRAEGFRYREIAEILGIKSSTVGEFLQRAVRKLAVRVHGYE